MQRHQIGTASWDHHVGGVHHLPLFLQGLAHQVAMARQPLGGPSSGQRHISVLDSLQYWHIQVHLVHPHWPKSELFRLHRANILWPGDKYKHIGGIHTQGMCKANTLSYHISRRSLSLTRCVTFTCSAYQRPCGERKYPPRANRSSITALRPKWVGDLWEGELQSKISDRAPYDCQMGGKRNQCGENFHPIDTTA